jgi:hypothetical protein
MGVSIQDVDPRTVAAAIAVGDATDRGAACDLRSTEGVSSIGDLLRIPRWVLDVLMRDAARAEVRRISVPRRTLRVARLGRIEDRYPAMDVGNLFLSARLAV